MYIMRLDLLKGLYIHADIDIQECVQKFNSLCLKNAQSCLYTYISLLFYSYPRPFSGSTLKWIAS